MKKLTLFLLTLIISCSAWAANIPGGTKLYLKPNSNWKTDNARFAAYFFGNGDAWVSMSKVAGETDLYEVTSPSKSFTNVIFCRMNPSASANNWNNKWNQTGDLTFDGIKDLFTINNGSWDAGSWSKCFTLSYNNEINYNVGDYYKPNASCTNLTNPTYAYKVNGNSVNIPAEGYLFKQGGTFEFTIEAKGGSTTRATATHTITINPTVKFNNTKKDYMVGETFSPSVSATKIKTPTYTYKVNGNPETIPDGGYPFTEAGEYTFTVEVKHNGQGDVLAKDELTVTITNPTVVYLKPNSNWTIDNARFAIYCFTSGENWYDMTDENGDGIYECIIPKGQTDIIFCRMTPSNTANNWDTKWNQTLDLKVPTDGTNLYEVKSGTWDKGGGSWSTYTPTELYLSSDLSNITMTISNNIASTTQTGAFPAGTYDVVVNDGTRYWQNATSITIEETVPTIDFSVDAKTKEITVTPKNTFAEPSNLIIDTEYGNLSYQLTMKDNRWYWIVLPYNVNVSKIITSTGGGWKDLVFTEYDAQRRAEGKNGWINWKTEYTNNGKDVPTQLTANKGYVIGPKDAPFNQTGDFVVTFPSASATNTVAKEATNLTTKDTEGKTANDNWHIIGTGLYHEGSLSGEIPYVAMPTYNGTYNYYYINKEVEGLKPYTSFAPFEAFFVQYGGTYSASITKTKSAAELAPVARAKAQEQEQIYLINMNEARTVVILNAEGSEGYTAGEDFLEMNLGSRIEMIYSFDGTDALAFNHRATEAQSIALGGFVATAGEQTISLNAYNGNAEAVTLIDNLTGETTDLLTDNYTFTAEVGPLDGRFTVVFAAQKTGDTTIDYYNSVANQVIAYGTANACTVSGLTAGEAIAIYNTMGQLVFATIANSETITLPSLSAGNYLILHNGTTNKVTLR